MRALIASSVLMLGTLTVTSSVLAVAPDCSGVDRWPTSMAFVHLKNAGITSNEALDFAKTETTRLASEEIGENLYRQVHLIRFIEKSGRTIEVVTINDASSVECSMSGVEVFVIAKRLGDTVRKPSGTMQKQKSSR